MSAVKQFRKMEAKLVRNESGKFIYCSPCFYTRAHNGRFSSLSSIHNVGRGMLFVCDLCDESFEAI